MDGRALSNSEFWSELVARNCGRTDPLRHRNKLVLLLAGIAGLRESELTLLTIGLFVSPVGELREFVVLPDSITRDGFERPISCEPSGIKRQSGAVSKLAVAIGN